ncbi:EpsG family protein [Brevibacterium yomogidense]|uniref:EpsG family protein n=1 Tax=Brevibacterium yomogidense TaxID=946573 RepID=UPI0018DF4665
MAPYLLVAAMATVAAIVGNVRGLRALWWILPPAVLIPFVAGRADSVGTDTRMYHGFFLRVDPHSLGDTLADIPQEFGYVSLMYVVRQWTDDYRVWLTLCAVLTVYPVLLAIRRASSMPVLSLFLYISLSYYLFAFNGVRQAVALSLVLLAETYRDTHRVAWILLYVAALGFHISVVLVFVVMLLARRQRTRPLPFLVATVGVSAMGAMVIAVPAIGYLLTSLNERYEGYLSSDEGAGIGTILVMSIHLGIALFLGLLLRGRDAELEQAAAVSGSPGGMPQGHVLAQTGPLPVQTEPLPVRTRSFPVQAEPAAFQDGPSAGGPAGAVGVIDRTRPRADSRVNGDLAVYTLSSGALILALTNVFAGRFEPYFGIFVILCLPNVLAEVRHRHTRGFLVAIVAGAIGYFCFHTWFYNELIPYESTWSTP